MHNDLLRYKKDQKYFTADTETNGLNLLLNLPWQVSWVEGKNGKVVKENDLFIDWGDKYSRDLEAFINEVNKFRKVLHFDKEKYHREKQSPEAVWEIFSKDLYDEDGLIVGHNFLGFDVYMINSWRKKMGLKADFSYINRVLDTRALGIALTQGVKSSFESDEERTLWQYKLIRMNKHDRKIKSTQEFLLKELQVDFDPNKLHDGLYDVQMCFENLNKLLWKLEI